MANVYWIQSVSQFEMMLAKTKFVLFSHFTTSLSLFNFYLKEENMYMQSMRKKKEMTDKLKEEEVKNKSPTNFQRPT